MLALICAAAVAATPHATLWRTAQRSLEANRVSINGKKLLTAGRHQFGSLWTRDFAFASRGLFALGDTAAVRDQLDAILDHVGGDHGALAPRVLDTISIPRRVVVGTIANRLGLPGGPRREQAALEAQVLDEHGSPSMDSNLLVIQTAFEYAKKSGDTTWLDQRRPQLEALFRYYDAWKTPSGLLHQPKWSDWQDSVKREGESFYVNLLYLDVSRRLGLPTHALAERVQRTFYDPKSGLYRSLAGKGYISLDGNLLAIDLGLVTGERATKLYAAMKKSPLWQRGGVPGSTTYGNYPKSWLHLPAKLTGLSHYHDELHWSWLIALSAKVAHQMGDDDESTRILTTLEAMAKRDGSIGEIYKGRADGPPKPFTSLLYRSEAPFSWGAGFVLDALAAQSR